MDHSQAALDGQELFERFAGFGVGRHGAHRDSGVWRAKEIDSSGFIKFFRDCDMLHQPPDNLTEGEVDVWWSELTHKLAVADPDGVAHVTWDVFRMEVLIPLAQRKQIGPQLLVTTCLSKLPKLRRTHTL